MLYKLETERLMLLPLNLEDLDIFHQTNIDPFVRKYLWDDEEIPASVSTDILTEVEQRFQNEHWGLWKILTKEGKQYIGYTGLWYFFEEAQPQLLYALLPQYVGKGYATEAAARIISYAFEQLNFSYLIASTDGPNKASVKVCERLNMNLVEEKIAEGKSTLFFQRENPVKAPSKADLERKPVKPLKNF